MIFAILVLLGFAFWFMATWPVVWAERVARGLFLAAAFVWALPLLGAHTG
jgi:hypothetical protein